MARGHHAHRRRAYGRRQHELRERRARQRGGEELQLRAEASDGSRASGSLDALLVGPAPFRGAFAARWVPEAG